MVADALKLGQLTIEEKALFRHIFNRAYAEARVVAIDFLAIDTQGSTCSVEPRVVELPQFGLVDKKVLRKLLAMGIVD